MKINDSSYDWLLNDGEIVQRVVRPNKLRTFLTWLVFYLFISAIVLIVPPILADPGAKLNSFLIALQVNAIIFVVSAFFILLRWIKTVYIIVSDRIIIQSGYFKKQYTIINKTDIRRIKASKDLIDIMLEKSRGTISINIYSKIITRTYSKQAFPTLRKFTLYAIEDGEDFLQRLLKDIQLAIDSSVFVSDNDMTQRIDYFAIDMDEDFDEMAEGGSEAETDTENNEEVASDGENAGDDEVQKTTEEYTPDVVDDETTGEVIEESDTEQGTTEENPSEPTYELDEEGGYYDEKGFYHDANGGYFDDKGYYFDNEGGYFDDKGCYYDAEGGHFDEEGGYYDAEGNYYPPDSEQEEAEQSENPTEDSLTTDSENDTEPQAEELQVADDNETEGDAQDNAEADDEYEEVEEVSEDGQVIKVRRKRVSKKSNVVRGRKTRAKSLSKQNRRPRKAITKK